MSPHPLQLDDRSLILAQNDVLYVFGRRGAFDLKGKDVDRLHGRLAPYLQGTHTEEDLLAAVPLPAAGPLRAYFDKLRQAGALRTLAEPVGETARPLDELGPGCPNGRFVWRGHPVEISLDGAWPAPRSARMARMARLEFLRPDEAGPWLWQLRAPGRGLGNRACVVETPVVETLTAEGLRRRAAYARWLLGSGFDPERPDQALLYELDTRSGDLRRRLALDGDRTEHALRTLPDQLEIVRSDGLDQLPLAIAHAAHPYFAPVVRRMGLDRAAVRLHLLRDLLVRLDLGAADGAMVPPAAASRCEAAILLAERAAEQRAAREKPRWTEVDLLACDEPHPAVRCLQGILRLRRRSLWARRAVCQYGAVLVEHGPYRALSFLGALAVAEVLLGVVWELFYGSAGEEAPRPALDLRSFAAPPELQRLAARLRHPRLRAIRRWGIIAWTEELRHATP